MAIESINGVDVLNTSEMSCLLGVSLTVKQVQDVGYEPYATSATATLWRRKDVAEIAIALADKLLSVSEQINKDYK